MVSRRILLSLLIVALGGSGCGLANKWWGEPAPPSQVIQATTSSKDGSCADPWTILEGDESESSRTFECWAGESNKLWTQIKTSEKDVLTDASLGAVLRSGAISLPGRPDQTIDKIFTVKTILGMDGKVTRAELNDWLGWIRENRASLRHLYQQFFGTDTTSAILYGDLQLAADVGADFLHRIHWAKNTDELGSLFLKFTGFTDTDIVNGTVPGMKAALNLGGMICPSFTDADVLDTDELANCLEELPKHFSTAQPWFEFIVNPIRDLTPARSDEVKRSLDQTYAQTQTWFQNPKLKPLDTRIWFDWAKKLGAAPPENFIDSLKFIRRFNEKSTETLIQPIFILRIFGMVRQFQRTFIEGLPVFVDAYQRSLCGNRRAKNWRECALVDFSARKTNPSLDMALRAKNIRNGQKAAPLDGGRFLTISLFNAMSEQIFQAFGGPDGKVIAADVANDQDELVQLILTGVETYQSINRYISNLKRKFNNLRVLFSREEMIDIGQWDIRGFAKLIAMSSDVLVQRTPEEQNIFVQFLSNLTNSFPKSAMFLDRPAVTAILATLDSLSDYRRMAIQAVVDDPNEAEDIFTKNAPILRAQVAHGLSDILQANFPRTAFSCTAFGFDRSCQIALDELLPAANPKTGLILPSDLDILTIISMGMEGVFDSCDVNADFRLSWSLLNGDDELDCAFTKMKDILQRLIESKIIQETPDKAKHIDFLLNSMNSVFVTRVPGKIALVKGSQQGLFLSTLTFWNYGDATVGSAYGLFADIVDSERTKAAASSAK